MISTVLEYERTQEDLRHLQDWLDRLQRESPIPDKGFTKAGIRKMIARLHEELAVYEGRQAVRSRES